jgi:hypothetical protein
MCCGVKHPTPALAAVTSSSLHPAASRPAQAVRTRPAVREGIACGDVCCGVTMPAAEALARPSHSIQQAICSYRGNPLRSVWCCCCTASAGPLYINRTCHPPGARFPAGGTKPSEKAAAQSNIPWPLQHPASCAYCCNPMALRVKLVRMDKQLLMLRAPGPHNSNRTAKGVRGCICMGCCMLHQLIGCMGHA